MDSIPILHASPPVGSRSTGRRGQSLAEFALVLPILLLLIFGIIEFGRMFQAWVSLQNAARAAARYASTGAIHYDIFADYNEDSDAPDLDVLDAVVPCTPNDDRGTLQINAEGKTDIYNNFGPGGEGLFATWYDGTDCDPTQEDHQQFRKDLLRLASIMWEARESVNALSVEWRDAPAGQSYYEDLSAEQFRELLFDFQHETMERDQSAGWFSVSICSSRGMLNPASSQYTDKGDRFVTVRTASDAPTSETDPDKTQNFPLPFCMLNEKPPTDISGALDNSSRRWLDAGGPGERVTISIKFNHPLITPLRLPEENWIQMEARRSIVNESFRAPKAIGAFQPQIPPGNESSTTLEPTTVPSDTHTPTNTLEPTNTPTRTATETPEPFTCTKVEALWYSPPFDANTINLYISNGNVEQTELLSVSIQWEDLAAPYNMMYLALMSLHGDVHWAANGGYSDNFHTPGSPAISGVNTGTLSMGYRFVPAGGDAVWQGIFYSGPSNLLDYVTEYDFDATFTLDNPIVGQPDCVIPLTHPEGGEPTEPPPPTIGPSPTPTPNCVTATNNVSMAFGGFETFGGVYFNITNNAGRDLIMTGFDFVWPDEDHPEITSEPTGTDYGLAKVLVGGDSVLTGQLVWKVSGTPPLIAEGNEALSTPYNDRTTSATKGTWLINAILPPGVTRVYMDFDTVSGSLTVGLNTWGAKNYHFDTSKIKIACQGGGGAGGGGGEYNEGEIGLPVPSPTTTNTPKPTNTPGPSSTPKPATKTWTPTKTFTAGPPTNTATPVTPTLTPSITPIILPTDDEGGGGESEQGLPINITVSPDFNP